MATATQTQAPKRDTFEIQAWRFMRWSGVLLIPLVFGHLAYIHIVNSVAVIAGADWVLQHRWAYLNVRIYDAFLLWFAALHGFNGLRYVINDYIHQGGLRRGLTIASGLVLVIVLTLGTVAIVASPGLTSFWGGWTRF
ncbi:MAG: succinate dehydrogenase [Chloroflexi bacterium]|nr:succinate dehydrogenase [Chloroflexota bacterium]